MRPLGYMRQWLGYIPNEAKQFTTTLAKFLGLIHVTDAYLFSCTLVQGPSMLPTINFNGDVVLYESLSHRFGKVGPGDVVMVRAPNDPRKMVGKRVLGVEGDKVTYFVDPRHSSQLKTIVVPKGHVWIQGDNIYASFDSRSYGPVPYGLIQGRVFYRKNAFEWGLPMIPHSEDAVQVTQQIANFLVREARKSLNRPPIRDVLDNLIYNYSPTFCGKAGKGYDEVYIFTKTSLAHL